MLVSNGCLGRLSILMLTEEGLRRLNSLVDYFIAGYAMYLKELV